jgi:signal transduction histidine kinase
MDYSSDSSSQAQHFRMSVTPIHYENVRCVVSHTDITELRRSREESLQRLEGFTRRLIHAQEEERERLAREIHDDLGNRIALLSFAVGQAANRQTGRSGTRMQQLSEIRDKITDLGRDVRGAEKSLRRICQNTGC